MDGELARTRDRRLRRRILWILRLIAPHSPTGECSGRLLADQVGQVLRGDLAFEDDEHAMGLLKELEAWGFLQLSSTARRGERYGLDRVNVKISGAGMELLAEARSKHPGVEDER